MLQILRAARFAHRRGIVHRDIKPHNVIVDDEGRAKVTDFGIARAGASDMTETGSIMGTAQYLSPEQAQGHPVDARSDLYSIGIVLYELLTGRVPFDAESAVTIALKQVSEEPVPPLAAQPGGLRRSSRTSSCRRCRRTRPTASPTPTSSSARSRRCAACRPGPASTPGSRRTPAPIPGCPAVAELEAADRRNLRWLWILLALLALAAIAVGAYLLLTPDKVAVPDVVGRRSATAAQILQNEGFEVERSRTCAPTACPRDRVTTQRPQPPEEADEGSTVTIIVSSGPGDATIPFVRGSPRAQAERKLKAAGFKVDVRREYNDDVPSEPGDRDLAARALAARARAHGDAGRLARVAQGRGARRRRREPRRGGAAGRGAAGCRSSVTEREDADKEPGTVLAQTPAAGTEVAKDSTVTLTVAKAPPQVEVPDVLGEDVDDAAKLVEAAGFTRAAARADGRLARGRRRRDHAEPAVGREARQGVDA